MPGSRRALKEAKAAMRMRGRLTVLKLSTSSSSLATEAKTSPESSARRLPNSVISMPRPDRWYRGAPTLFCKVVMC